MSSADFVIGYLCGVVIICLFMWAVAGAECNTVIELKLEHHAA